jgi:hypothetical protein
MLGMMRQVIFLNGPIGAGKSPRRMAALAERPVLVIAMPLRAREWIVFRARFGAGEIATYCVTLATRYRSRSEARSPIAKDLPKR